MTLTMLEMRGWRAFYRSALCAVLCLSIHSVIRAEDRKSAVSAQHDAAAEPSRARMLNTLLSAPLEFEANQGQTNKAVKFFSRGAGYSLFLTSDEAVLSLRSPEGKSAAVRMRTAGANAHTDVTGLEPSAARSNYFECHDAAGWHKDVPQYGRVHYRGIYPGVDLTFYGNQHRLEYDFMVAPGADPDRIRLRFDGMQGIRLNSDGDLQMTTSAGDVRIDRPVIYQMNTDGSRATVQGSFVLARHQVSFRLGDYDRSRPLVIDPVVNYSTLLGGSSSENYAVDGKSESYLSGIALGTDGSAYVVGVTSSADFPTLGPYQSTLAGSSDIFVTKFNPDGTGLVYSTYLGGSGENFVYGIVVDGAGNAYIAGGTSSADFPVTAGAYQGTLPSTFSGFVAKLNPTGDSLLYSTFLGGTVVTETTAIAIDSSGNAYLTGLDNGGFPTTAGAFQATVPGQENAFVAKLAADGKSLLYSTYIGGEKADVARGIAVDSLGDAYITGFTTSTAFPVVPSTGEVQPAIASTDGTSDGFVTEVNPTGTGLIYSTYLGGTSNELPFAIAIDAAGSAYVTGFTDSSDFPTASPVQPAYSGNQDAFVTKLAPGGTSLVYSTYLGGGNGDAGLGIVLDQLGDAYVSGYTASTTPTKQFPTLNSIPLPNPGSLTTSAFVTEFNPAGSAYIYSTFFGGEETVEATGIAIDPNGNIYITGVAAAPDSIASPGAYQQTLKGNSDAFVAKLWPLALTPAKLAFPNTSVGSTSSPLTATLTNSGFATLNISSLAISGGNASDFAQTNDCGGTLAPQSSCTISVTFTPASVAAFSSTAAVSDDAASVPQIVTLTGNGITAVPAPQAVLNPTSIAFGNQASGSSSAAMVVALSNPGNATLNIGSIAITGANPTAFGLTNGCTATLAAGASCNLSVNFSPSATGSYTAAITVTDNAANTPQTAALSGTGTAAAAPQAVLTPSSIVFGNETTGSTSAAQMIQLSNPGTATLNISSIALAGANPSDFSLTNGCGTTLAAGANCVLNVSFTPGAAGNFSAIVTVADNAAGSPQTATLSGTGTAVAAPQAVLAPTSIGFGSEVIGTASTAQIITLSNPGNATLNISSIALGGANPAVFGLTNGCGATLAAGANCSLSVAFAPSSAGVFSANLTVTDNASNSTQVATLSGTGTVPPAPQAVLAPSTVAFGNQVVNTTSSAKTVTLSNPGTASLSITSISLTGADASTFTLTNGCSTTLTAGASCTLSLTFSPASAASLSASVSVTDNASGSPQTVALTGTGINPDFAVSSPTSPQTVSAGAVATYQVNVAPSAGDFDQPVTLSASGLPAGATATFTPATVTPGTAGTTSSLAIQTAAPVAASGISGSIYGRWIELLCTVLVLASCCFFRRKIRLRRGMYLAIAFGGLLLASLGLTACGGGFPGFKNSTTYVVTVTGTNAADQHSTTVTLTVQ